MKHRISIFANAVAVLAAFGVVLLGTGPCAIAQEKVLHSFNNDGTDGFYPQSSLFLSDNLLGTTTNGGASNLGTAFRVDPQNGDEAVLGNVFESPTSSGAAPYAGLGFFSPDNTYPAFYSTTSAGGANNLGSIYLMKILGSGEGPGSVIEGVLFSFQGADGSYPYGGLTGPVNGNLYGTTTSGGAYNSGTVFEFTHKSHSFWEEKVLHKLRQRHGRVHSRRGPDYGCFRKFLRHDVRWRHIRRRYGLRVAAEDGRRLGGAGSV
jgi:uncharacterized repeat protein (TIGR03803 family)